MVNFARGMLGPLGFILPFNHISCVRVRVRNEWIPNKTRNFLLFRYVAYIRKFLDDLPSALARTVRNC